MQIFAEAFKEVSSSTPFSEDLSKLATTSTEFVTSSSKE